MIIPTKNLLFLIEPAPKEFIQEAIFSFFFLKKHTCCQKLSTPNDDQKSTPCLQKQHHIQPKQQFSNPRPPICKYDPSSRTKKKTQKKIQNSQNSKDVGRRNIAWRTDGGFRRRRMRLRRSWRRIMDAGEGEDPAIEGRRKQREQGFRGVYVHIPFKGKTKR